MIAVNTSFRTAPWADYIFAMDHDWHAAYGKEARSASKARIVAPHVIGGTEYRPIVAGNSGAGAIKLAAELGAKEIILIGYDCQHTGGAAHWHADHPAGMGNAGTVHKWPAQFAAIAAELPADVAVINCTRQTALTQWPCRKLEDVLLGEAEPVVIVGMHGMGDCIHQRAIVREYMRRGTVYLKTPWPELYHDLRGSRLKLLRPDTRLRTQAKNAARADFDLVPMPSGACVVNVKYPPAAVRLHRGVLPAMAAQCGVPGVTDYALPVPSEWQHGLDLPTDRPVIVYRPMVERREWGGCAARNPSREAYVAALRAIRDEMGAFVVSVADIEQGKEWIVSDDIGADMELHSGELAIKQLCALWRDASLIYSAPGFGLVLAQAVGTPVVSLFGGYEKAYSFRDDAITCKIEPDDGCDCFTHDHGCGKRLPVDRAVRQSLEFARALLCRVPDDLKPHLANTAEIVTTLFCQQH